MRQRKERPIAGIDIGTTKICVAVGVVKENGFRVAGISTVPFRVSRKGLVTGIEEMIQSIKMAIAEAEAVADCRIDNVYLGIGGKYIKTHDSHGSIILNDKMVKEKDIRNVVELAVSNAVDSAETEITEIILQEFIVDGQRGIQKPLEMAGRKLEVKVHVVSVGLPILLNIIRRLNISGLKVAGTVLRQLASSEAVLSMDEKELGIILMDIGGETTDIAIYSQGILRHTLSIPAGGNIVTRDIAIVLRIPLPEAERLKKRYGCAMTSMIVENETVEVMNSGGQRIKLISKKHLAEIIEARVEEFLHLVKGEIQKLGFRELIAAGIVITGGSAKMPGMIEITEGIFGLPTRIGVPAGKEVIDEMLKDPVYATGVGLTLYGRNDMERKWLPKGKVEDELISTIRGKIARWLGDFFGLDISREGAVEEFT